MNPSANLPPYHPHPPTYSVHHHQPLTPTHHLTTKIGTYPSLAAAQLAAQSTLQSALHQYTAQGWTGYYCADIDLEYRGLVTGVGSAGAYVVLCEVGVYAGVEVGGGCGCGYSYGYDGGDGDGDGGESRGQRNEQQVQVQVQVHSDQAVEGGGEQSDVLTPTLLPPPPPPPPPPPQAYSFSQSRPPFPDRPAWFVHRGDRRYDETMAVRAPTPAVLEALDGGLELRCGARER